MSFRKSLSKFQEKVKHKLKIGDKSERKGPNIGGEGFYRSALSSQSEPGIVVEGEFRGGGTKVGVGKDYPRPDDSQSVSRSVVGSGYDTGGSDDNADGGETSLHPHPHLQAESGSSGEGRDVDGRRTDQADPPPQSDVGNETPSISRGESEST